jgi:hypothetical protein
MPRGALRCPGGGKRKRARAASATQWALIGDETAATGREHAAGISDKVVRVSWKDFEPTQGEFSHNYRVSKLQEIATLEHKGMRVILDLGIQDTPAWIHDYPDSYLMDQYGEEWSSAADPAHGPIDESDANLIFNPQLRSMAQVYIAEVAQVFGRYAYAIRVGGGRFNELGYPTATTVDHANVYWAYDPLAQAECPVPGWRPGDPSPNGEAGKFLTWYLQSITDYQDWQVATVRDHYSGPVIVLYPGWGIRPGQVAAAVADDLDGATSAEINGEIQMGHDFASEVAAIDGDQVWAETTWLDAPLGDDASADPDNWSPVHYLARVVAKNPWDPEVWGENTGSDSPAAMRFAVAQAKKYHVAGVVWYKENQLFSGRYANLADYGHVIRAARSK